MLVLSPPWDLGPSKDRIRIRLRPPRILKGIANETAMPFIAQGNAKRHCGE